MYLLRNRPEKLAKGSLFCLFLKLVQINFIFTDNVRILYIYPAISTFAVQIWYRNKFLLYSYKTNKLSWYPVAMYSGGCRQVWNWYYWTRTTKKTPLTTFWKARNDACFCPFCLNLTSFPTFLTLQDKHNIRTLSLNIKCICTCCETGLKSSPKARYSACF